MADSLLIPPDAEFPALQVGTPHSKCLTQTAPGYPPRASVGPGYAPPTFTAEVVLRGPVWADPPQPAPPYSSYEGETVLEEDGLTPRNPRGRTGLRGRGRLGRWGANFAADPIVTRIHPGAGRLEMIAILRKDSGEWAIPGGMVDFGEALSGTLARELAEEALGKEALGAAVEQLEARFQHLFETRGRLVYAGYVDDPRNTDNAWMETKAVHLHLDGTEADLELTPGDDAGKARWMPLNRDNLAHLYASHGDLVGLAVREWQAASGQRVLADGRVEV